jgi:Sigma-70, region 4
MKSIKEPARNDIELALNNHGNELSPRSMIVIKMLYGLMPDGKKYSAEEISQQMSVPRKRIFQVRERALTQLKPIAPESPQSVAGTNMDFTSTLLQGSERALRQYNEMSSAMWAPEGYIRDMCAMHIHQQLKIPVSIELGRGYFEALWGLDLKAYEELRNFKVDLATHHVNEGQQIVAALVEFKLYPGDSAKNDFERLRTLVKISESTGARVEGYLVICRSAFPHQVRYWQDALEYFSKTHKIKIAAQTFFEIDEIKSLDRDGVRRSGPRPSGVAVINVVDDAALT